MLKSLYFYQEVFSLVKKYTSIPNEWKICDGQYNTPDLRSKFVIGHDSRDTSFNNDSLNNYEIS